MKKTLTTLVALAVVGIGVTACDTMDSSGKHAYTAKDQHSAKAGTKAKEKPADNLTAGQEQAVGAAQDYLSTQHFSEAGLIDQLSSKYGSGFKKADAVFAVHHIKVDWNQQAVGAAKDYLSTQHFSRAGLIGQLSSDRKSVV